MEIVALILSNPVVLVSALGLVEIVLGVIPNDVLPYKSVILKFLKLLGQKSEVSNDFTRNK
jgi:hypothetical protein